MTAYGMSLLLGGKDALKSAAEDGGASGSVSFDAFKPDMSASSLVTAGPHSGTTFDIVGSAGIAILVIVGATVAMDRLPRLRRLARPVIAVGGMSLTAYVGHFFMQSALPGDSWVPLLVLVLGAVVFATTWSHFFRRGPLEQLLNVATKPAKHIR
ncbi:DUF418 domain-containing protein [Saccharothrix sp.]|uniref:DUF418 domain-containing protein n=1 Tax=Saccharothrix sp. TaxID=1873460 RepID=UPI002811E064|nr:DUF418 domain-containing protein [Saccharothrix sp.]